MKIHRLLPFVPVILFLALVGFFIRRLELIEQGNMPNVIPSVMINRPAPDFDLPSLIVGKPDVTSAMLKGQVTLVDVFASWCVPCQAEHPFLFVFKKAGITLVGLNYKDKPEAARAWLQKMGSPYDEIGSDSAGRTAIDFGTYGVPESYLVDKNGIIRYKQIGPLTPEDIQNTILPLAKELAK